MAKMNDKDAILEAYADVRDDKTETNWCCLKYDGNTLGMDSTGTEFDELKGKCGDDERVFAFLRIQTGDEMSKRMKFVLVVWQGPSVSSMKKAKMSTDKAFVKQVFLSFALEMMFDERHDFKESKIREDVMKAGGANYGTGQ